jgi:hypothetical protein
MTAPTEQARSTGPAVESSGIDEALTSGDSASNPAVPAEDTAGPGARPRRSGRGRRWRYGFPILLVLLIASVPALIYMGIQVVLRSNDGRLIAATADPKAPGWEATVPPTPTMMVASVNDAGGLSTVAVLILTADKQGSVLLIPADTQVTANGTSQTLVDSYKAGGSEALKTTVESLLGAAIDDMTVMNGRNWQDLVTPVGSLTFDNPDNVIVNGALLFPEGPTSVAPSQVGSFLFSRNWLEDDTNRLLRQEQFWKAWFDKVVASRSAGVVPGEVNSGIGRYVRTLAGERVQYAVFPVKVQARSDAYAGVYLPLPQASAVVNELIPFPTAPTLGARPRVRVLDGTGRLDHGLAAARNLSADGAQVDSIGNAESFHQPRTQFIVTSEAKRAAAQKLATAFGLGTVVVNADADDAVDVTVVLGSDAVGKAQAETTSVAPSASASPSSTGANGPP